MPPHRFELHGSGRHNRACEGTIMPPPFEPARCRLIDPATPRGMTDMSPFASSHCLISSTRQPSTTRATHRERRHFCKCALPMRRLHFRFRGAALQGRAQLIIQPLHDFSRTSPAGFRRGFSARGFARVFGPRASKHPVAEENVREDREGDDRKGRVIDGAVVSRRLSYHGADGRTRYRPRQKKQSPRNQNRQGTNAT